MPLTDVVNAYQNTTLNEEQMSCIFPPPFCAELFRSRHPTIILPDTTKVRLVVQAMSALQGTKPAGKQWNDRLTCFLKTRGTKQCVSDYGVCAWCYDGDIVILNLSADNILVATSHPKARQAANYALAMHF